MKLVNGFYTDENNNKWHSGKFSIGRAIKLSMTMIDCHDCTDCQNCVSSAYCVNCKNCENCLGCQNCDSLMNAKNHILPKK